MQNYDQQSSPAHAMPSAVTVAPIYPKREASVPWASLAPYLVACAAVAAAVAALCLTLSWRTSMQAQVNLLRHEVATTQAQLSAAADSGQGQLSGLSRSVKSLRSDVAAISALVGPYAETCTTDATAPSGLVSASFLCRP